MTGMAGIDTARDVPKGKLAVTITSLEMMAPPAVGLQPAPLEDACVLHAPAPTVAFYRFLYNSVGEPWLWGDRRRLSDEQLMAIIGDPRVEIHVLYLANQPAGYAELDTRRDGEVELAYFGLLPEFTGRKLGPWLLRFAIHKAWEKEPDRLWLHTCSLDHPAALDMYRAAGFRAFKTEQVLSDDPRSLGLIPAHAAPHIPLTD